MTSSIEEAISEKETLSSNTLFHFASKLEYLITILENNFAPRYYLEDLTMLGFTEKDQIMMNVAIPMTCFCDIPLSKMKYHLNCYGGYGIGMTKNWGVKNGVSPVLYAAAESETTTYLKEILKIARRKSIQGQEGIDRLGMNIKRLISFVKPYEGDFEHSGKSYLHKRFYDEREWRYVPVEADPPILSKEDFLDKKKLLEYNSELSLHNKLAFTPNDVEYIIVKDITDVLPMIKKIMLIKANYSEDERMLLASKIISRERIMNDF